MAINYVEPGTTFSLPAPSGGVTSGQAKLIGDLFVVFQSDAEEGELVAASTCGVYDIPKGAIAFTQGEQVFMAVAGATAIKTATGASLIGVALRAAASGDESVQVLIGYRVVKG